MSEAEFSRMHDRRKLPTGPVHLQANESERAALAERFGLLRIDRLEAELTLAGDGEAIDATGRLDAAWVQTCAVTGEELPVELAEDIAFRFVPERTVAEDDIDLEEHELDEISYDGTVFDLGEAVAQSLVLAVDPYATGPDADRVRAESGLDNTEPTGPFAALAKLRKD